MSIPAIVLDGQQRSALATVRSLGRLGHDVTVADSRPQCLAGSSRFCKRIVVYPDPASRPGEFQAWLERLGREAKGAVLLPMTDVTIPLVLRSPTAGGDFLHALPDLHAYEAASDKFSLFELATSLGVRVPAT
jgi:hypothetical protein